jgi:GTP-binding protein HflX
MELRERALLVGVDLNNDDDFEKSMDELENLAEACGYEVAGRTGQNLKTVSNAYYIGTGKVEETAALVEATEADLVIFDNELTPAQQRNLEKALHCRVLDRTQLILEIFAQRARTKEAMLQVEVARLQYMLPRLAGRGEFMDRQGGGGVGTVVRGGGEKKIVLDRRRIEQSIAALRRELKDIRKDRHAQRKRRSESGLPLVALVGYTNAGKSTVMNALVEFSQKPDTKKVFEKDMLFATLETSVRRIELPDNRAFLLSDTVGFVSKLPHELVKAFRSTLEEVKEADLLLHVVDASDPEAERQIRVTEDTLRQIGAGDIPVVYVFNKADLTGMSFPLVKDNIIYISAKERTGVGELAELIRRHAFKSHVDCRMFFPYEYGNVVSYLRENAYVKDIRYENGGTFLQLECSESDYRRYRQFVTEN